MEPQARRDWALVGRGYAILLLLLLLLARLQLLSVRESVTVCDETVNK